MTRRRSRRRRYDDGGGEIRCPSCTRLVAKLVRDEVGAWRLEVRQNGGQLLAALVDGEIGCPRCARVIYVARGAPVRGVSV